MTSDKKHMNAVSRKQITMTDLHVQTCYSSPCDLQLVQYIYEAKMT